jgi:hypothetical protein
LAGLYFVRDKFPSIANGPELPGLPYTAYDGIIPLDLVREIPLTIQDRSFTTDSQLWYPVAAHPAGTTLPNGPLHPRWVPEYSATLVSATGRVTNYIMWTVNGRTYPRQVRRAGMAGRNASLATCTRFSVCFFMISEKGAMVVQPLQHMLMLLLLSSSCLLRQTAYPDAYRLRI